MCSANMEYSVSRKNKELNKRIQIQRSIIIQHKEHDIEKDAELNEDNLNTLRTIPWTEHTMRHHSNRNEKRGIRGRRDARIAPGSQSSTSWDAMGCHTQQQQEERAAQPKVTAYQDPKPPPPTAELSWEEKFILKKKNGDLP